MHTPRQLFNQIMNYERPERVFNWNWTFGLYGGNDNRGTQFWQQTIDRWHAEGLPREMDTQKQINDFFAVDRRLMLELRTGIWPAFIKEIVEETDRFVVSINEDGGVIRQFKGAAFEGSMPEYLHRLIESAPDAANFQEARKLLLESDLPVELFVGSEFGLPRNWMDVTGISYALYDDPDLVAEMMSHIATLILSVFKKVLDPLSVPIDMASWWEDMAYNHGPLISPVWVRRLIVPNYIWVNEDLHRRGTRLIGVDSDGNCEKLIAPWLEAGITCIFPNEVAAGSDVVDLRRKFGRDLHLIGGIDKRALARGPEVIREELERRLPLVSQGGYLPAVDHSVPPDISFDNYLFYQHYLEQRCQHYLDHWLPI
jgi:uroporphyrinogen decarboxylase